MEAIEKPTFLRMPEVARHLGVSRSTAYALLKKGDLPYITLGGSVRVPRAAIERLAAKAMRENEVPERLPDPR